MIILPAMCFNNTLSSNAKLILSKCRRKKSRPKPYREVTEICPLLPKKGNVPKVCKSTHYHYDNFSEGMDYTEAEIIDLKIQEDLSSDEESVMGGSRGFDIHYTILY